MAERGVDVIRHLRGIRVDARLAARLRDGLAALAATHVRSMERAHCFSLVLPSISSRDVPRSCDHVLLASVGGERHLHPRGQRQVTLAIEVGHDAILFKARPAREERLLEARDREHPREGHHRHDPAGFIRLEADHPLDWHVHLAYCFGGEHSTVGHSHGARRVELRDTCQHAHSRDHVRRRPAVHHHIVGEVACVGELGDVFVAQA